MWHASWRSFEVFHAPSSEDGSAPRHHHRLPPNSTSTESDPHHSIAESNAQPHKQPFQSRTSRPPPHIISSIHLTSFLKSPQNSLNHSAVHIDKPPFILILYPSETLLLFSVGLLPGRARRPLDCCLLWNLHHSIRVTSHGAPRTRSCQYKGPTTLGSRDAEVSQPELCTVQHTARGHRNVSYPKLPSILLLTFLPFPLPRHALAPCSLFLQTHRTCHADGCTCQ